METVKIKSFNVLYNDTFKENNTKNENEVLKQKDLDKKILNRWKRSNALRELWPNSDEYLNNVLTTISSGDKSNPLYPEYVATYSINPTRQDIDEKSQEAFIESFIDTSCIKYGVIFKKGYIKKINKFLSEAVIKLPQCGNGCIRLQKSDGSFVNKKSNETTSAFDFKIVYSSTYGENITVYITCKGTHDEGHGQENNEKDAIETIEIAAKNKNKNIIFCALLDGDYYCGKNYDYLDTDSTFISDCYDFPKILLRKIKKIILSQKEYNGRDNELENLTNEISTIEVVDDINADFCERKSKSTLSLFSDADFK